MKREPLSQPIRVCISIACLVGGLGIGTLLADSQRRGDKTVPITVGELPSDVTDISWAAQPVPVDGVEAVALGSPERTEMAGEILAGLLSDPTFRYQVQLWFQHYDAKGFTDASARAKRDAASVALAFADALIEAAG